MNKKIKKISGTIAALSTAKGMAGLAVIRVSGAQAKDIFTKVTKEQPTHMRAYYSGFYSTEDQEIDKGVALFFAAPNSYTGEDICEFSVHGSPAIIEMMLERVFSLGARQAQPGEFTKRAYLNDKLDLTQAEAVADLIESVSSKTARAAKRSLSGEFSNKVNELLGEVTKIRALVEAMLDFSDQDLDETKHPDSLTTATKETKQSFQMLIKQTRTGIRIRDGLVVTILGRPNVGKSSLFNEICGSKRAIVNSKAGTTRDIVSESITIDGFPVKILDTAGIRESEDEVEKEGIKRAIEAGDTADMVLEVFDARDWKKEANPNNNILVLNKADLLKEPLELDTKRTHLVSAKTGEGINNLLDHISAQFTEVGDDETVITARKRHMQSIKEAYDAFCIAERGITKNKELDLVAEELLQAQNSLAEVTGEFTTEDLLEAIFNSFCIGK